MAWFRLPRSFRTYLIVALLIGIAILTFSTSKMLRVDASDTNDRFPFIMDRHDTDPVVGDRIQGETMFGTNIFPNTQVNPTDIKTDYHTTRASLSLMPTSLSSISSISSNNENRDISSIKPEISRDTIIISASTSSINHEANTNLQISKRNPEKDFTTIDHTNRSHAQRNLKQTMIFHPQSNYTSRSGDGLIGQADLNKREFIKNMMRHAWKGYSTYAWGYNELRPISKMPHLESVFGNEKLGASIVDGIDTLYLMGLHDEYQAARNWIENSLDFDKNIELSVFETNIRYLGGLLSIYALTMDPMYVAKAKQIGDRLLPAFDSPSGVPYSNINLHTGYASNHHWSYNTAILSEFGSMHLEFIYLSHVTGDPKYRDRVEKLRSTVKNAIPRPDGLYNNYMNTETGQWLTRPNHISIGALGDSFYEYLIKAFILSDDTDTQAYQMYFDAIKAFEDKLIFTSNPSGLIYFAELKDLSINHKMDSLACFAGGMLALGATKAAEPVRGHHLELAHGVANTCHESCIRSVSHLGPESFVFTEQAEARAFGYSDKYYILRPEILETYFYMWRLTHNPKYREWAWDFAQSLEKHCKVDAGYSGIRNVYQPWPKDDVQQSFFLAEVLKYLYLIFSDDDLVSLDQWVFNTEAHPFPILKKHQ